MDKIVRMAMHLPGAGEAKFDFTDFAFAIKGLS
jgi:hypothetical protein